MSSTKLLSNSVNSAIYSYIENSVKGNKNYPNSLKNFLPSEAGFTLSCWLTTILAIFQLIIAMQKNDMEKKLVA
ncbi:hypothetical protein T02_4006 [Trichinella nativa]|uniref:Uncharacterized protein n=1 Tax=Trichinella nativa TaxID=6335 RepID=A0A0V1KQR6_9BILA|nr:hypothetical protein T06_11612 [Trichinella sp. T6]KRZ49198.1 hypothetical protein T02_4006 [Trichinella nativa]